MMRTGPWGWAFWGISVRYRCGHCRALVSLPLQGHATSCPACRRPILVNPEKPLLNFWFLAALVIFAAPTAGTLLQGHWGAMEMLSASTMLPILPAFGQVGKTK